MQKKLYKILKIRFLRKIREKFSKKLKDSKLNSIYRLCLAFFLRYFHIWKISEIRKSIIFNAYFVYRKLEAFNFLNSASRTLSYICFRLGWKRQGLFLKSSMVERNGLNRHVLCRYLMKELFLYFSVAFLFFFMMFFVNQILLVAENILKKRVPVMDVLRLIEYSLPMIIAQSAPFATLVGFLMCLGRLASDNEILIFRASGHGYTLILKPVLVLGLLISFGSFFVNDYLLPLGTINYNKLYRSILTSNPAVELESNSIKRTNDKTLVIGEVSDEKVSDMVFFDTDSDGNSRIIIAEKSEVRKSTSPGILMNLEMNDADVIIFKTGKKNDYDIMSAEKMELNIFESTFIANNIGVSPREMTSYDLFQKIQTMKNDEDVTEKIMNQYKLEFSKKFSMPFGSIFFAILALPLALLFGKHNGQTIGLILGIFISVFYWAVNIVGQIFSSRSGLGGAPVMWIPNILIGITGILFYLRLVRK